MIELHADEMEFAPTVSGIELAVFTEMGAEPLLRFLGGEDELVAMLSRCAEQVGEHGYEITMRDPGPPRYTVEELITGEYGLYDGGIQVDRFATPNAAYGLAGELNKETP